MVKNNGGNKAKKMIYGFASSGAGQAVTRLSECEEEMYVCIIMAQECAMLFV